MLDAVRLRAAHVGVPLRPRQCWPPDAMENEENMQDEEIEDDVGRKAICYTPTRTLFIRVTQGKQGVLQIHQARIETVQPACVGYES